MGVEARPLRRRLERPGLAPVIEVGIALSRRPVLPEGAGVLVCGLAGALTAELDPGTVFVPERVALPDGSTFETDRSLTRALLDAAERLRLPARTGGLLTAASLVTGKERAQWGTRGFLAVDMETALLASSGQRLAGVRVVLDTPGHELSPKWERPSRAALDPRLWREAAWLLRFARTYADRAALVAAAALAHVEPYPGPGS